MSVIPALIRLNLRPGWATQQALSRKRGKEGKREGEREEKKQKVFP
jgi:hypothetical protein